MQEIYRRIRPSPSDRALSAAVFLDRDGVLIEDPGYLSNAEDICYIDGSLEAVRRLNEVGLRVILVTNQSGIARGYYGWSEFESVQNAIETKLAEAGAWLDGVWACPFLEEHPFRKPNPGMLHEAAEMLHLDLTRSAMVGDRIGDIAAGVSAGVKMCILVETGEGSTCKDAVQAIMASGSTITVAPDLSAAVEVILAARW